VSAGDTTGYAVIPRWLQRDPAVTIYAKAVYVALSSRADEHGVCWPSHAVIAEESSMGVRKVADALQELRDLGAVTWEQQVSGRSGQQSNRYQVHAHRAGAQQVGGLHDVQTPSAPHADPGSAPRADERTPENDHQRTTAAALLPADDEVVAAEWSRLQEADGRAPGKPSGPARKSLQQLLRDGVPVERVLQVVGWLHVDGRWWLDVCRTPVTLGSLRKRWASLDAQCPPDWARQLTQDELDAQAHAAVLEHAGITDAEWAAMDAVARQELRWAAEDAARERALRDAGYAPTAAPASLDDWDPSEPWA
jgi:hypothetical protein